MRTPGSSDWKTARLLSLVAFVAYALFLQDPRNPNSASRMFLAYAMTGERSVSIDEYASLTIDRADFEGHFYSDKAPGQTFLALPAVAVTRDAATRWEATRPAVRHPGWPPGYLLTSYAATLSTSGLLTALSVGALFLVAVSLFGSPVTALLVAITYGFATPAFGWATAFFGHATAMALCVLGFALLHFLARATVPGPRDFLLGATAAACLTGAVITEFTAAPAAALIALYAVATSRQPARRMVAIGAVSLLPVIALILPLFAYNQAAFGSPLHLGYSSVKDFPGMKQGFFGLTSPSLSALYGILIGPQRGILWICPLLLLVPLGGWAMLRRDEWKRAGALSLALVIYYLLLNASYHYWNGGDSTGPRHVTVMLPFACLTVGAAWSLAGRTARVVIAGVIALSLVLAFVCTMSGMYSPEGKTGWLPLVVLRALLDGSATATPVFVFDLVRSRYFLLFWAVCAPLIGALLYRRVTAADTTRQVHPA